MRFLRLDFRDDLNSLDFHPLLTVVSDLEPNHQRQLLEAVRRLSGGSTVGLRGLVEHQGLMVELDASSGAPLAPINTTAGVLVYVDGEAVRSDEVGLQAEIDQWERQAAIDAVAVEEIRSDLDLAVRAKARALRGDTEVDAAEGDSGPVNASAIKLRIAAVREAFQAVAAHEPTVAECDPQILQLIEEWEHYSQRRSESDEHLRQVEAEVRQATAQLEQATGALDAARAAARPVQLTAQQETRLEELCDQHNEQSRLGKWKKALTEEEDRERQELLGLVGVKSWTEYSVYRMSPTASPDKRAALDEAEAAAAVAQQALDSARSFQARDSVASELQVEFDRIKAAAEPYLGVLVPADLGTALKEQIQQIDNPDWVEALNQLRDVLSSNDLHPPYGFEPGEILGWTESWLRAEDSLESPADPSAVETDLEDEEQAEARRVAELETVNRALAKHNRALAQIGKAERAAVRSAMRVRELKNQLRTRSTNPDATTAAEVVSIVAPVAEQVLQEVGGSVPIAVVGDLAGIPESQVATLMRAMEEVAQQVQVIMITGHREILEWADSVGLERAGTAKGTRVLI